MLGEGRWERKIDEKDRFPIPAKIRKRFGAIGVWAINPGGHVILCPRSVWRQMLKGVDDLQHFRETWQPFEYNLDDEGRLTIPSHIRKRFGQDILLMSMDKYLKVFANGDTNSLIKGGDPMAEKEEQRFQDSKEAAKCFHEGREVVYLGHATSEVIGKFHSYSGAFFSFSGQDPNGVRVSVNQVPYWEFRSKEPLREPAASLS